MANILIVDDSYIMRMKIKTMLTNAGHTVVGEAINGEQAIHEYTQKKPDIVTMDISMPVMDGILSMKMILSYFPEAKIIVISALDKKNMVFAALEGGAKNYILKPIDEAKLISTIDLVLKDEGAQKTFKLPKTSIAEQQVMNFEAEIHTPFSIDNKSGTFVINIGKTLHSENFMALGNAVQGFLYIKPLSIVFNFGHSDEVNDDVLESIKKLVLAIKLVGGHVRFASANPAMHQRLTAMIPGVQIMSLA